MHLQRLLFLLVFFTAQLCVSQDVDFSSLLDKKIIGFGEMSHGNKHDYEVKAELVRQIIGRHDSIDILIEMPYDAQLAITAFSQGEMDTAELLDELHFYGLKTDAFLDFIGEFAADERVRIYSVDMQHWHKALEVWCQNTIQLIPDRRGQIFHLRDQMYAQFGVLEEASPNYVSARRSFADAVNEVRLILPDASADANTLFHQVVYPLQIVEQCFKYKSSAAVIQNGWSFFLRDSCMGANAVSLMQRSTCPRLLIGANVHVSTRNEAGMGGAMGWHIEQAFGDDYFCISSQALRGEVLSVNLEDTFEICVQRVEADKKSLPYAIYKTYSCSDTLILMSDACSANSKMFCKKIMVQDFGAGGSKSTVLTSSWKLVPCENFDAVFYSPKARPSRALR